MLTMIASGLSIAGLALLARKLSAPFRDVLQLSEDLDPLRPPASSEFKSPRHVAIGMAREDEPCGESILRLSGAVAGAGSVYTNSEAAATQPDEPITTGPTEPRR